MLTFDPVAHRYWWNGQPVLNVTRALTLINDYSKVDPERLARAQEEGIAMHKTVELFEEGALDEATLPQWLVPRLAAYKRFKEETGFVVFASEQRLYHPMHRYCGTADLFGEFQRIRIGRREVQAFACIDIKRSFYADRAVGLQTAAYAAMWEADRTNPRVRVRYALRFLADATYRLLPCERDSDFADFLSVLNVYRLKEAIDGPCH